MAALAARAHRLTIERLPRYAPELMVMQRRGRGSNTRGVPVSNMESIEAKAFVPARDFGLSRRFDQDLCFVLAWSSNDLAFFRHGNSSFLVQNLYSKEHADNVMMHLLVE